MKLRHYLFYAALILIRIPPFYFFPIIKSSLLTTHTLARVFLILLSVDFAWNKRYKNISTRQWELFGLFMLVFFAHSISLINAIDSQVFLLRYKDLVFPGILLLCSFVAVRKIDDVVKVLMGSLIFNFIYQLIMFFAMGVYLSLAKIFVYEGHASFVGFNLARGRIFIETYDEIVLPIVLGFAKNWKYLKRSWVRMGVIVMVAVPTLLSNFRSRLLMLLIGLGGLMLKFGKNIKVVGLWLLSILILAMAADRISLSVLGFSLIDRVFLRDRYEDVQSLESRVEGISESFYLANQYFPLGIGMGNYFYNLPMSKQNLFFGIVTKYGEVLTSALNPHNIFAQIAVETGYLGLCIYLFVLYKFAYEDYQFLRKNKYMKFFSIAFWVLFSYAVFNPSTTLTFNSLFWFTRSMSLYESRG